MNITPLAEQAGQWALRRAQEKSTWIRLPTVAVNLGWPGLADYPTGLGDIAPAALSVVGAAFAAASTTPRPAASAAPTHPLTLPAPADPRRAGSSTREEPGDTLLLKHL
jgi:hypothetical protein